MKTKLLGYFQFFILKLNLMESINFLLSISFCLQILLFFYVCSLLWSIGTESYAICSSIFHYLLEQNACTLVTREEMHGKVAPSGSTKTALMNTHYVLSLCILPSIISQQDNINTTCVIVAFVCQKIPLATRLNTKNNYLYRSHSLFTSYQFATHCLHKL